MGYDNKSKKEVKMTIEKILTLNYLDKKISVDYDFKKTIKIYSLDDFLNRDYAPLEVIYNKNFNYENIEKQIEGYINE